MEARSGSVKFQCCCSRFFELQYLYYCQECKDIKCSLCVSQEIDSFYCPNCLDNMTTYDSMLFRNRCKKCFDCPSCSSLLSYSQRLDKDSNQRIIYFHCGFCRWNSLNTDLTADAPNLLIANYIKQERNSPQQLKVHSLVENYRKEARELRLQMRSKRFATSGTKPPTLQPSEHPPITFEILKQTLTDKEKALTSEGLRKQPEFKEQILPQITKDTEIDKISSLEQRLSSLPDQSTDVAQIYPQRRQLLTRRSKRCWTCDKLLIKPDLIPSKIDFERRHIALFSVPRISFEFVDELKVEEIKELIISLYNPLMDLVTIKIKFLVDEDEIEPIDPVESFIGVADESDSLYSGDKWKNLVANENTDLIQSRNLNVVNLKINVKAKKQVEMLKLGMEIDMVDTTKEEQVCTFKASLELGKVS
eukprot:TRINITY_DN10613_c0_g1_i1.p1 TRINITY_DN10613_c0_g1~~TRINITY_DN10613_c0_g1_i1.p1  ORF type:complete len:419 (+),score=69.94 TRINITY_DN10613_c0_g1_i1:75-1331(+)